MYVKLKQKPKQYEKAAETKAPVNTVKFFFSENPFSSAANQSPTMQPEQPTTTNQQNSMNN